MSQQLLLFQNLKIYHLNSYTPETRTTGSVRGICWGLVFLLSATGVAGTADRNQHEHDSLAAMFYCLQTRSRSFNIIYTVNL